MRFDGPPPQVDDDASALAAKRPRRWLALLQSQGLGLLCGQLAVLLLAIGSVVISATRQSASAQVHMDDLRAFLEPINAAHSWLYLLVPLFALYALNTLLCTLTTTLRKWRLGQRSLSQHGPALIHLALVVAMVAHLVGGLYSREHRPVIVTRGRWTELGDGRQATLLTLTVERHASFQPKQVRVDLAVRQGEDGVTTREEVAYNQPLSKGWGARLYLLADFRYQRIPWLGYEVGPVVTLRVRDAPGNPWALASTLLMVVGLVAMGRRFLQRVGG